MKSFMLRATPNPGNLQNQNQDDYALGVFNLVEAYNGIDSSYPDYDEWLNNRINGANRQHLSRFCDDIRLLKSYGGAPNPPIGPSSRRKRRCVDYYY